MSDGYCGKGARAEGPGSGSETGGATRPDALGAAVPDAGLDALRRAIDEVDGELLALLNRRAALSVRVGECKRGGGKALAVFQPQRERRVVDRLLERNAALGGPLPARDVERIWREIFSSSRALQQPVRVAFLGPEGTFSHMAALECLGHGVEMRPMDNFYAVFRDVGDGRCELGLVPLENSLHGSVGQNFDLFAEHSVHIVGEHYSRITHCLMSAGEGLEAVRRVYSHPQPLGQCAAWLRARLPGVPLLPEASTAAAARRVRDEPDAAAIGHPGLAGLLGLRVLAAPLEDEPGNWTRFALVAPGGADVPGPAASGAGSDLPDEGLKTSLLFTVAHRPGSLARVLSLLAGGGINMTKLESRPMRGAPWQYVFFVDTGCDLLRPEHAATMEALRGVCRSVRVLGVYPQAAMPA